MRRRAAGAASRRAAGADVAAVLEARLDLEPVAQRVRARESVEDGHPEPESAPLLDVDRLVPEHGGRCVVAGEVDATDGGPAPAEGPFRKPGQHDEVALDAHAAGREGQAPD